MLAINQQNNQNQQTESAVENDANYTATATNLNERITELQGNLDSENSKTLEAEISQLIADADEKGNTSQQVNARYILYRLYSASNRTIKAREVMEQLVERDNLNKYDRFAFLQELIIAYTDNPTSQKKYLGMILEYPEEMFDEIVGQNGKQEYVSKLEALE
jgi:hypothetical protein